MPLTNYQHDNFYNYNTTIRAERFKAANSKKCLVGVTEEGGRDEGIFDLCSTSTYIYVDMNHSLCWTD